LRSSSQHRRRCGIDIELMGLERKQFFLRGVAQNADQRWIHIQKPSVRCAEVSPLLQRLEKFGEAKFLFVLPGHIAPQHANPYYLVALNDGIQHAIEIQGAAVVFEAQPDCAGPVPALQKTAEPGLNAGASWLLHEVEELVS